MDTATLTIHPTPRQPRTKINYALAATLVAQGLTLEDAATQVGAKNANSLKVGLARRGVTATRARRSESQIQRAVVIATQVVSKASERLKGQFSDFLSDHVGKLNEIPAKANIKHIKKIGEAAEPLARIAKIVHGWGEAGAVAVVTAGQVPDQDQLACGPEPTAGCIDVSSETTSTPQDTESP